MLVPNGFMIAKTLSRRSTEDQNPTILRLNGILEERLQGFEGTLSPMVVLVDLVDLDRCHQWARALTTFERKADSNSIRSPHEMLRDDCSPLVVPSIRPNLVPSV